MLLQTCIPSHVQFRYIRPWQPWEALPIATTLAGAGQITDLVNLGRVASYQVSVSLCTKSAEKPEGSRQGERGNAYDKRLGCISQSDPRSHMYRSLTSRRIHQLHKFLLLLSLPKNVILLLLQ